MTEERKDWLYRMAVSAFWILIVTGVSSFLCLLFGSGNGGMPSASQPINPIAVLASLVPPLICAFLVYCITSENDAAARDKSIWYAWIILGYGTVWAAFLLLR